MQNLFSLDLALFGGFIVLSLALIIFRRFHHFETLIKPEDIGPTAWGLYANHSGAAREAKKPLPVARRPAPRI